MKCKQKRGREHRGAMSDLQRWAAMLRPVAAPHPAEKAALEGENIAHKFSIPFGFMVLLSLYMRNLVSVLFFEISLL